MSKALKVILFIGCGMIPVGIIIFALGVLTGGKAGWTMEFGNGGKFISSDILEQSQEVEDFDDLEIEVSSVDVFIMQGDEFQISYKTRSGHEPEITQEGGTLKVRQPSRGFVMFDLGFTQDVDAYTITVPEGRSINLRALSSSGDIELDSLDVYASIEASSGEVLLNDTTGERMEVSTSSGEIDGDKVKNKICCFKSSSGDINMLRMFVDEAECTTSSGDIDINNSEVGRIDCSTTSGEVEIEMQGDPDDYSWNIQTSSGDIEVNETEYKKEYARTGTADKEISIRTSSGDIDVDMK